MSITTHTTTITWATACNMKRTKLIDSLLLFADKSVKDEAEIERLKSELELRTRERDQAIEFAGLTNEEALRIFKKAPVAQITFPELFARLAGRGV